MLEEAKMKLSRFAGNAKLTLKRRSPEILLGIGIISFGATVITACKATLAIDEILEKHEEDMKKIEDAKVVADDPETTLDYDEDLYKRDKVVTYVKTSVDLVKLYAPSVALAGLSLTCILASRNIMQKRYLGAVAAYNAVSEAFKVYRKRVIDENGVQMDRHYMYGAEIKKIPGEVIDEDGKKHKVKEEVEEIDTDLAVLGDGSVFFDESSKEWDTNASFNKMFLNGRQAMLNDMLQTRGYLFLNEVYHALGLKGTPYGGIVGWKLGKGDNFVDFGLGNTESESVRRFVNGLDNKVLLTFNHDGMILNEI